MAKQSMKNPANVASKWMTNLSGATETIKQGVQAVTTAPTQLAAQQSNAYLTGVQNAVASGKWQQRLQSVSLADWQNAMLNKGVQRIQSGAAAGKSNVQSFMTAFLPYVQNAQQQLASQPRGNLEQNIQRSVTWQRAMAGFTYNK